MNQHESWCPVENSRVFFTRQTSLRKWEKKRNMSVQYLCIFHMHRLFFSRQIFIYFFLNWKYLNQQIKKRLAKHTTKLKSLLIYVDIFDFFSLCCLYSALYFFAVMSHLTKFAWFYFPFHSIGGGRGFKLIWKKIPCFINVCKTNAFPNNCAAALIDKQTDIQFAIMAVFSLYCIRIEWLFFTPSTFGIWYVYISYMLIIYVGRFCVCMFQYSSFDDEKNYICF